MGFVVSASIVGAFHYLDKIWKEIKKRAPEAVKWTAKKLAKLAVGVIGFIWDFFKETAKEIGPWFILLVIAVIFAIGSFIWNKQK